MRQILAVDTSVDTSGNNDVLNCLCVYNEVLPLSAGAT